MQDNIKSYEWGEGVFTLLSWFKKDTVKNARVLVAGAGALGNEVVKNLALFGVGHIYVVDFDKIEITNLTRSVLFREEDAFNHSYKADVVAKRAMEINPQIKVTPIVGDLSADVGFGIYRSVDVVIGCLDSRIARYLLNRLSMRAGKTWIDGSIENMTGAVRVYTPGISCYECGLSREEFNYIMLRTGCADVMRVQGNAGRVATTPISASIIGAMQVQEAMKVIHLGVCGENNGEVPFTTLQGKMLRYEGLTNKVNIYKYSSWKHSCPAHARWNNIVECRNLSATHSVGDVLLALKQVLGVNAVEINMCNNRFVDKIISDTPEKEFLARVPESKLEDFVKSNDEIRSLSYRTLFHKVFIENIDDEFPYMDMTLLQVGIPLCDVIQVSTDNGLFYVELSQDRSLFDL